MRFEISNSRSDRGIALILVLLALFVLSVLAAAMVFTARSEIFSSYNYRTEAQAEFVAYAGVQRTISFFNDASATGYQPLGPYPSGSYSPTNYYSLTTYTSNPIALYFSTSSPVTCQGGCTGGARPVKLGSGGNVYPPTSATSPTLPTDVVTNWKNALTNQTISDGQGGWGTYDVTASLLEWHTVNNALLGVPATGCSDPSAAGGVCRTAYEVWLVTSTGSWTGATSGGAAIATVQIQAKIAPFFVPYFGDALYGLCSMNMNGGTCTDAYNSASGNYGGSPGSCVTPGTSTGTNATASGAGIGSNGGITLSGTNYSIGGNVTFANSAPNAACNSGFTGSTSGVAGSVLPSPAVPPPPVPKMDAWGYTCTSTNPDANCTNAADQALVPPGSGGSINIQILNAYLSTSPAPVAPPGATLAAGGSFCPAPTASTSGFLEYYTVNCPSGGGGCQGSGAFTYANYNCVALTTTNGSGTSTSPFLFSAIDASGSGTPVINLIAPAGGVGSPTYAAADYVNNGNGGYINLTGQPPPTPATAGPTTWLAPYAPPNVNSAIVLDVGTTFSIGGKAEVNYNPASPGVPSPDYLHINVLGTDPSSNQAALSLSGQAQVSAVFSVPNGSATLSGSGSGGVFFGSILSQSVTDKGGYAIHYDLSLAEESGLQYAPKLMTVTRPMY